MKRILKINFLALSMIAICHFVHGQQKPSQRSYSSVVNEIKQKQALRNKMLQQINQTTPAGAAQNGVMRAQPAVAKTMAQQQPEPPQKTIQQPINNKQTSSEPPSTKLKKE